MNKNAQLHIFIDNKLLDNLKEQAFQRDISVSELCRQKLRQDPQLDRIERMVVGLRLKD